MLVQILMLTLVVVGTLIYGYRVYIIAEFYKKTGRMPKGKHSTSNLIFGALAFGMIVYLWNELNWPAYVLLLFGLGLLFKLSTDFYYTHAQLYRLSRHSEPAA